MRPSEKWVIIDKIFTFPGFSYTILLLPKVLPIYKFKVHYSDQEEPKGRQIKKRSILQLLYFVKLFCDKIWNYELHKRTLFLSFCEMSYAF